MRVLRCLVIVAILSQTGTSSISAALSSHDRLPSSPRAHSQNVYGSEALSPYALWALDFAGGISFRHVRSNSIRALIFVLMTSPAVQVVAQDTGLELPARSTVGPIPPSDPVLAKKLDEFFRSAPWDSLDSALAARYNPNPTVESTLPLRLLPHNAEQISMELKEVVEKTIALTPELKTEAAQTQLQDLWVNFNEKTLRPQNLTVFLQLMPLNGQYLPIISIYKIDGLEKVYIRAGDSVQEVVLLYTHPLNDKTTQALLGFSIIGTNQTAVNIQQANQIAGMVSAVVRDPKKQFKLTVTGEKSNELDSWIRRHFTDSLTDTQTQIYRWVGYHEKAHQAQDLLRHKIAYDSANRYGIPPEIWQTMKEEDKVEFFRELTVFLKMLATGPLPEMTLAAMRDELMVGRHSANYDVFHFILNSLATTVAHQEVNEKDKASIKAIFDKLTTHMEETQTQALALLKNLFPDLADAEIKFEGTHQIETSHLTLPPRTPLLLHAA